MTMGIAYITLDSALATTPKDIDDLYGESHELGLKQLLDHSNAVYCYTATDIEITVKRQMKWMVIHEIADMAEIAKVLKAKGRTQDGSRPEHIHERYFDLQESHESEGFRDLKLDPVTEPNFLVAVCIHLQQGRKGDFDKYYSEEHMDALKKVPGWRRTRRFVTAAFEGKDPDEIECLALHDYSPENGLGGDKFKAATTTAWYKDMMSNAVKHKTRRTYDLFYVISPAGIES